MSPPPPPPQEFVKQQAWSCPAQERKAGVGTLIHDPLDVTTREVIPIGTTSLQTQPIAHPANSACVLVYKCVVTLSEAVKTIWIVFVGPAFALPIHTAKNPVVPVAALRLVLIKMGRTTTLPVAAVVEPQPVQVPSLIVTHRAAFVPQRTAKIMPF